MTKRNDFDPAAYFQKYGMLYNHQGGKYFISWTGVRDCQYLFLKTRYDINIFNCNETTLRAVQSDCGSRLSVAELDDWYFVAIHKVIYVPILHWKLEF